MSVAGFDGLSFLVVMGCDLEMLMGYPLEIVDGLLLPTLIL